MEHTFESLQMRDRTLGLAIGGIAVDSGWGIGSGPTALVTCIALQLLFLKYSESIGLHDSEVMDDGSIDRFDAGLMGVVIAGRKGAYSAVI